MNKVIFYYVQTPSFEGMNFTISILKFNLNL